MDTFDNERRRLLGGTAAAGLLSATAQIRHLGQGAIAALAATQALGAVPADRITVLYRPETQKSPNRVDPVIMSVTRALEAEFLRSNFRLVQPTPDVLGLMDKGQGVIITFAEDAGFTLVYSAYTDIRPVPGQEAGIAEVRLSGRVFVGRHTLSIEDGRGQMFTRMEPEQREFGVRRAFELAGQRAAADMASRIAVALRALTSEQLEQMVPGKPSSVTTHVVVPLPSAGVPALPPMPAPAPPLPTPAAAPVTTPSAPASPPVATVPSTAPTVPVAPPAPAVVPQTPGPVAPGQPIGNKWAVVVAMSDYSGVRSRLGLQPDEMKSLPGVSNDFKLVLSTLGELGFSKERTAAFLNEECTSSAIKHSLKFLANKVQPNDVTVVFFSAHGGDKQYSPSRFGMPILADFKPRDADNLDFWELQGLLKNLTGRVIWINDTCHSGGAATNLPSVEVGSRGVQVLDTVRGPDAGTAANGAPGQNFTVLTACRPSEISWEDGGGGLFTTRLFRELGATKGKVPLEQLFKDRVYGQVVSRSKEICARQNSCSQHPQQTPVMAYQGSGGTAML